jgi:hypothetical protein
MRAGDVDDPALQSVVRHIQLLQALQSGLDRNPNVRLAFERVLIEMHAARLRS